MDGKKESVHLYNYPFEDPVIVASIKKEDYLIWKKIQVKLEKIIKRRINLLGCHLHQLELSLQLIILQINKKANNSKCYKSTIGKTGSEKTVDEQPLVQ